MIQMFENFKNVLSFEATIVASKPVLHKSCILVARYNNWTKPVLISLIQ